MGYARTKNAVIGIETLLKRLLESSEDIVVPSNEPHQLTYKIHNAINAARHFPEFSQYSKLLDKYRIRTRPNKVVCELRDRGGEYLLGLKEQLGKMTFDDVDTIEGIVGAIIKHKPYEAYFPNFNPDGDVIFTLYKWTSSHEYHIINNDDAGVTLTKEPTVLAWQP